jgi:ribonuclease P protein component
LLKNGRKTGNEFFSVFLGGSTGKPARRLPAEASAEAGSLGGGGTRLFTANIAKKTFKKSVDRNRYKRWIRAVFHKHKHLFVGTDVLIMPRPGLAKIKNFSGVEQALLPLFPEKKG